SQLIEMWHQNQQASVDDAFKYVEADFRAYYALLVGPPDAPNARREAIDRLSTAQPSDGIDMLMKYGLIQRTPEGYEVFSRHFALYVRETMPVAEIQQADEEGEEFDEE